MAFTEDIAKLSEQVRKRIDTTVGEAATKQSLILPFFRVLGYDPEDPTEVNPEYISDAAQKKRAGHLEKVDYAIAINGTIVMLLEAKARDQKPETHDGQLKRYFNWTLSAKVGIVTNGVEYRFFTDLRNQNIMDDEPFFSFNILQYEPTDIENLKLFHKDNFDTLTIIKQAEEMVYVNGMTQIIGDILRSPSDDFIRFLIADLNKISSKYATEGKITSKIITKFRPIIKKSIQLSLVNLVTTSLNLEMNQVSEVSQTSQAAADIEEDETEEKIVTTAEELEAFEKIKTITATSKAYQLQIYHKDTIAYFGINLGKNTWWFLRFYLSAKRKNFMTRLSANEVKNLAAGFEVQEVSASMGDAASRVFISSVNDLDKLARLILKCYETEAAKH